VLIITKGWDFVTSDKDFIRVNTADKRKQKREALKIIFNLVKNT
jgi:bifunctional pyridoxal-dependent enzyme with beta-cystathionase and maltose regulon repressor activities